MSDRAIEQSSRDRKIVLVSCVKRKLNHPAPARDLYVSTLFRAAREWAEREGDAWFILSAKYGLLSPEQQIEPYEQTLQGAPVAEKRVWATEVREQMERAGILVEGHTLIWLAGMDYQRELRPLLKLPQQNPLEGMSQGVRVQWLQRENGRARETRASDGR